MTPQERAAHRRANAKLNVIDLHDDHEKFGAELSRSTTPNERLDAVFTLSAPYLVFPEDDGARVYAALAGFRALFQIGLQPLRIDSPTDIDSVYFNAAFARRVIGKISGIETSSSAEMH